MNVIHPDSAVFEGDSLTLDFIAVKTSGFTYDQTITCTNKNNISLSEIEGVVYPANAQVAGQTLHLHVQIPSVKLSHAGVYHCEALLITPTHLDNISHSVNFTIKVKGECE